MKSNFVVSADRNIWMPDAGRLFATDPYIVHVLEREGLREKYPEIDVAPVLRSTREEFVRDHDCVDGKFNQYSELLSQRLDELHGTSHGRSFWRKAMALSLLRHVTFCYDLFQVCEAHLNPEFHDCRVLDPACFRIPGDFDEHRQIFQNTELGQEQLFSIYCGLFYPGQFRSWQSATDATNSDSEASVPQVRRDGRNVAGLVLRGVSSLLNDPRRVMRNVLDRVLRVRSPRLGIIDCSFSPEYVDRLQIESLGRIQPVPLPAIELSNSAPQWDLRDQLVRDDPGFDRFDQFAFACLRHGMPRMFVEDFAQVYRRLDAHFNRYPDLRWVVCEWWIGHSLPSLALALLRQRGVKHIYNEHNYLSYFFVGNSVKHLAPLVDEFVTLGWEDKSIPNLVRGASLFPWVEKDNAHEKEHDILFICGLPLTHVPEITTAYGDSGAYRALEYFDMNDRFLARLGEDTLGKLYFRAYPAWITRSWLTWDQSFALAKYTRKAKRYDDSTSSGRLLMQQSRLVVVNYLSTSYLESIIADIPTILLWNKKTNLFTEEHMGAFDTLIEAGICHTTPESAADFVNEIKDNPERWWQSAKVRNGREAFLKANIRGAEVMIQYLLKKSY